MKCQVKEEENVLKGKRQKQVSTVKCQVKKRIYVIKLRIHFPLLSLDTSLLKPNSAVYNLPAIFECAKQQTVESLLGSAR